MREHTVDDRLRWERRARSLLSRLATISGTTQRSEDALRAVLDEVCVHTGWPVGHAFVPEPTGAMRSSRLWRLDDPERFAAFRATTETMHFASGVGLPGRVLEVARPVWIADVSREPNFPRARLAADLPVRGAFGFRAVAGGRVYAVLEFFSPEPQEPDEPLLEVMASAGALLGGVLERAAAGEALRRSELRFRAVVETANDAIISVDSDGHVVAWNTCAARMFGWTEAQMLGRPLGVIMPERFREPHEAGIRRVARGGPHHVIGTTVELFGLTRDGVELPIELSLATSKLGDETSFTGIIRDISRRRADEEALRRAARRLEESERTANEASRAKSIFLANMSHELRTPLNAILGFVQLMRRDASLGAEQKESLGVILSSGEHLLSLINDVLSIAKIEAGHVVVSEADFDLARLVGGLRELFVPKARTKQLTMLVDTDDLPRVRGDEAKLRQVLINLVGNAIKFTAQGGVALRARWGQGVARFEVEDSGRGIPAAEVERIFEPFVQGHEPVDGGEGTGLGLAISRSFVRAMGGELEVRSTHGQGSCFAFTVPLPLATGGKLAAPERQVVALASGEPESGILHRDIKPANVFLHRPAGAAETVKVVDFGIAKLFDEGGSAAALTTIGRLIGTPVYMSPERLLGKPHDARSDSYGVGMTLYQMISGWLPFDVGGENLGSVVMTCLAESPTPLRRVAPDAPAVLEELLARCLAKKPEHRPTVAELATQFGRILDAIGANDGSLGDDVVIGLDQPLATTVEVIR